MTAAYYLVRDGQMKGSACAVLEKSSCPAACDSYKDLKNLGYVSAAAAKMDNHFRGHVGLFPLHPVDQETEGVKH